MQEYKIVFLDLKHLTDIELHIHINTSQTWLFPGKAVLYDQNSTYMWCFIGTLLVKDFPQARMVRMVNNILSSLGFTQHYPGGPTQGEELLRWLGWSPISTYHQVPPNQQSI